MGIEALVAENRQEAGWMLGLWILRWVLCVLIGLGVYNLFVSEEVAAEENLVSELVEPRISPERLLLSPDGQSSLIDEILGLGFGLAALTAVNGLLSALVIRQIAGEGNRLWAVMALVFAPLVLIGLLTAAAPFVDLSIWGTITIVAPLDLALAGFIFWRICIDRSPFYQMGLIDYVEA